MRESDALALLETNASPGSANRLMLTLLFPGDLELSGVDGLRAAFLAGDPRVVFSGPAQCIRKKQGIILPTLGGF